MPIFKALDFTGTDTSDATATTSNILSGKTAYIASGKVTGSMTNRGAVSGSVGVGGTYTIQQGYHSGSGTVSGPTLSGNATASEVRKNRTFYSSSSTKQTGTMNELADYRYIPNQTLHMVNRTSYTDGTGTTQNISNTKFLSTYEGCSGFIPSSSNEHMILASRLGNASASDVKAGVTFTSGNSEVAQAGTMSSYTDSTQYINAGEYYYIQPGYHSGGYVIANGSPSGSIHYLETTLWTNSSPTSSMAQTTLSISYSSYDFVRILYRRSTSNSYSTSIYIKRDNFYDGVNFAMGGNGQTDGRNFSLSGGNSITFYRGRGDSGVDNTQAIPTVIIGVTVSYS